LLAAEFLTAAMVITVEVLKILRLCILLFLTFAPGGGRCLLRFAQAFPLSPF